VVGGRDVVARVVVGRVVVDVARVVVGRVVVDVARVVVGRVVVDVEVGVGEADVVDVIDVPCAAAPSAANRRPPTRGAPRGADEPPSEVIVFAPNANHAEP
jgi:hypothetical protein